MSKEVIIVDWKFLKKELKLPWSRQHFRRLVDEGKAPMVIRLGRKRVGWRLVEIEDYLKDLASKRDEQAP